MGSWWRPETTTPSHSHSSTPSHSHSSTLTESGQTIWEHFYSLQKSQISLLVLHFVLSPALSTVTEGPVIIFPRRVIFSMVRHPSFSCECIPTAAAASTLSERSFLENNCKKQEEFLLKKLNFSSLFELKYGKEFLSQEKIKRKWKGVFSGNSRISDTRHDIRQPMGR